MTVDERVTAILNRIAEMKANEEDMTDALSLLGVTINGEEE